MSSGRRSARRKAVFVLDQQDLLGLSADEALARAGGGAETDEYAARLVAGVGEHREAIDEVLRGHLEGWSLERLGVLERSIMRVAVYELFWEGDVPPAVIIDQAVGVARRFCSDEAGALVNGVVGAAAVEAGRVLGEVSLVEDARYLAEEAGDD